MERRNVSLDTLRSAAIVLVINCHIVSKFAPNGRLSFVQLGGRGVDLFFVLSGWLLGHYLLTELRQTGTIQIRRFWLRRWLRTLPAYYAVLTFTLAWQLNRLYRHESGEIRWEYLLFLQNYLPEMPYFSISWSLCVEEYFYLAVAPLLLFFALSRRGWLFAIPLLLVPAVCRIAGWYGSTAQTHVRFDQCAAGVLLAAAAVYRPTLWRWLCLAAPVLAFAGLIAALINVKARLGLGGSDFDTGTWTLIFSSFVLLANSSDFWRWRARVPGCRFIAERSYALYLVHIEALAIVSRLLNKLDIVSLSLAFVLTWTIGIMLAEILYRGIERPFMQARDRFAISRSPRLSTPVPAAPADTTVLALPTPASSEPVVLVAKELVGGE